MGYESLTSTVFKQKTLSLISRFQTRIATSEAIFGHHTRNLSDFVSMLNLFEINKVRIQLNHSIDLQRVLQLLKVIDLQWILHSDGTGLAVEFVVELLLVWVLVVLLHVVDYLFHFYFLRILILNSLPQIRVLLFQAISLMIQEQVPVLWLLQLRLQLFHFLESFIVKDRIFHIRLKILYLAKSKMTLVFCRLGVLFARHDDLAELALYEHSVAVCEEMVYQTFFVTWQISNATFQRTSFRLVSSMSSSPLAFLSSFSSWSCFLVLTFVPSTASIFWGVFALFMIIPSAYFLHNAILSSTNKLP